MKSIVFILLGLFLAGCANDGSGYASWTARETDPVVYKKVYRQGGSGATGETGRDRAAGIH